MLNIEIKDDRLNISSSRTGSSNGRASVVLYLEVLCLSSYLSKTCGLQAIADIQVLLCKIGFEWLCLREVILIYIYLTDQLVVVITVIQL